MTRHILSLEVPDVANNEILTINDTSTYAGDLPVKCSVLQITAPGFVLPVTIEALPNFKKDITACNLGLQTADCGDIRYPLPDGIYVIRFTTTPYDKVWVEYNHFRLTNLMRKLYEKRAALNIPSCDPDSDTRNSLLELSLIESYMQAAKAKAEWGAKPQEAIRLYQYAEKKLKQYSSNRCC